MTSETVVLLGELLSRGNNFGPSYALDQTEAAPLAAVLEVKVNNLSIYSTKSNHHTIGFLKL